MTRKSVVSLLVWVAIFVAMIGSILSAFNICTGSACDAAHSYRFFGMQFAVIGVPVFILLASSRAFRKKIAGTSEFFDTILFGCAGAEVWFLYIQKYQIGHWCPICVIIAVAVYFLVFARIVEKFMKSEGAKMGSYINVFRKLPPAAIFFAGLTVAMVGVTNAEVTSGLSGMWLGNAKSAIEIYFVGDWYCPYCRKAEATIEPALPDIGKVARYTFLDYPVHQESFTFVPYNITLLMMEKTNYMNGRKALMVVAGKTRTPDDDTIRAALAQAGIKFKMADITAILKASDDISKFLRGVGVKSTPVVVIRNSRTGEQRYLIGANQISASKVISTAKGLMGS